MVVTLVALFLGCFGEAYQQVTHIGHLAQIIGGAAFVADHIVAVDHGLVGLRVGGLVGDHSDVTGLALSIGDPILHGCGHIGVQHIVRSGDGLILLALDLQLLNSSGQLFQSLGSAQLIGNFLGLFAGSSFLVSLVLLILHRLGSLSSGLSSLGGGLSSSLLRHVVCGAYIVVSVVIGVELQGILGVMLADSGIVKGQTVVVSGLVAVSQHGLFQILQISILLSALAVLTGQQCICIGVTQILGVGVQVLGIGLQSVLVLLAQLVTGLLGSRYQSGIFLGICQSAVQNVAGPGFTGLLIGLLVQGLGGVQTDHGSGVLAEVAVPGVHLVVLFHSGVHIVVVKLYAVKFLAVHHSSGGGLLEQTVAADPLPCQDAHKGYQNKADGSYEQDGVPLQLLGFFLFNILPFGHSDGFLLLAELFLAGCAHVINSSRENMRLFA